MKYSNESVENIDRLVEKCIDVINAGFFAAISVDSGSIKIRVQETEREDKDADYVIYQTFWGQLDDDNANVLIDKMNAMLPRPTVKNTATKSNS